MGFFFLLFQTGEKLIQKDPVFGMERAEVEFMGSEEIDGEGAVKKEGSKISNPDDQIENGAISMEDTDSPFRMSDRDRGHSDKV